MKSGIVLLVLMLSGYSIAANARDAQQQFAAYGVGEYSCSMYSKARAEAADEEDFIRQWLAGYVTAFNLIIGDNYDIFGSTDFEGMISWLDERCQKYPNENLTNAVARFTEITYPYRKVSKPAETK